KGKVRPLSHYALGWLPLWGKLLTTVPGVSSVANAALSFKPLAKMVLAGGGMDTRRGMVEFNTQRFSRWAKRNVPQPGREDYVSAPAAGSERKRQVLLWADSFSEYLSDAGARATVEVLQKAGFEVLLPESQACCGLTLISTGQLDAARSRLENTMEVLTPYAQKGIPIVGVAPSCTAVLRSDLVDLFPEDARAKAIAARTRTLSEALADAEVEVPDLSGRTIVVQP